MAEPLHTISHCGMAGGRLRNGDFFSFFSSFRGKFLKEAKFNNTSRNNWKPLFEINFSKNSTKTIKLFALDFYEVIEISSS